jgi:simple sugar transport system permease protein
MANDVLTATMVISILVGMMRISTPLLTAALGELVGERAGILNVGIEGMMLMGAFVGFLLMNRTNSFLAAEVGAALVGATMGLILVFMSSTLKVNQIITGLGLNLLASGLSFFGFREAFPTTVTLPTAKVFSLVPIPYLSKIPVLGEVFFSQYLMTYFAFIMLPLVWFFLYKTKLGLQIRCLGDQPRALDMKGISVTRLQYCAVLFGGAMAGIGGSFLTLASTGIFVPGISAGRGWLVIVIVIAGNWSPFGIGTATLAFALVDSLQLHLQSLGTHVPYQLLLALPYIFAIVVMMAARSRSAMPRYVGVAYNREE